MFDKIERYCDITSPSGYESEIREAIRKDIEPFADSIEIDGMGNMVAFKKGRRAPERKTLISAHMDEVGMIVKYITEDGRIYFSPVGGIDRRVLGGKRVVIGKNKVYGTISSKAIHIQKPEEKGRCEDPSDMTVDIGASSRGEALKYIRNGDYIAFAPNYEEFGNGFVRSKAIDDRFGCAVLAEIMSTELEYDTYFAFCVCEECGCDGARVVCERLKPQSVVVIEATTAGDISGAPPHKLACILREGAVISHMDNGTIYDKACVDFACAVSRENKINAQLKNIVAGGNEAKSYQTYGGGARVIAISCPTRYIHSPACVAAKEDMQAVYELAKAIIERGF